MRIGLGVPGRRLLREFYGKLVVFPINAVAMFLFATMLYVASSYIVLSTLSYDAYPLFLVMPHMYTLTYIHLVYLVANAFMAEKLVPQCSLKKARATRWLIAILCLLLPAATLLYYYSIVVSTAAILLFYIVLAGVLGLVLLDIVYVPLCLRRLGKGFTYALITYLLLFMFFNYVSVYIAYMLGGTMATPLFSVEGIGSSNLRRELARAAPTLGLIVGVATGLAAELVAAYAALRILIRRGESRGPRA